MVLVYNHYCSLVIQIKQGAVAINTHCIVLYTLLVNGTSQKSYQTDLYLLCMFYSVPTACISVPTSDHFRLVVFYFVATVCRW